MSNKIALLRSVTMLLAISSCSPFLQKENEERWRALAFRNFVKIEDPRRESMSIVAAAIMCRSEAEAELIPKYIKNNMNQSAGPDKIFVPGDGSLGSFLIERQNKQGNVEFIVIETGIEDERGICEKSIWQIKDSVWLVRDMGKVPCPLDIK